MTEPTPLEIVAHKKVRGKTQHLVRYSDDVTYWCRWVSPLLLKNYEKKCKAKAVIKPTKTVKSDGRGQRMKRTILTKA